MSLKKLTRGKDFDTSKPIKKFLEKYQDMPFEYLTNEKFEKDKDVETRLFVVTQKENTRAMVVKLMKLQKKTFGKFKVFLSEFSRTNKGGVGTIKHYFDFSRSPMDKTFQNSLPFVGIMEPRKVAKGPGFKSHKKYMMKD